MRKRKICVIVTSRANYARSKSVICAISRQPKLHLQLVVGASALLDKYGSAIEVIRKDGFKPSEVVHMIIEGETPLAMAKSTGLGLIELSTTFENLKPDIVLVTADRFEVMAAAIAATYMNIPLAHVQGGEISGSIDESVRHAISKLAHIHFPATKRSGEKLIKLGEQKKSVYVTGCPSIDILKEVSYKSKLNNILTKYGGLGKGFDIRNPFLVVVQHPVTTEYGSGLVQIKETIKAVSKIGMNTLWLWPNVDAGSDDFSRGLRLFHERQKPEYVYFLKNLSFEDFARVMHYCSCIVGNSSVALREGSFLGTPAVNIGTRQDGREKGSNVIDVGYNGKEIKDAILKQLKHGRYKREYIFGNGGAGEKIANVLANCKMKIQKRIAY